MLQKYQLPNGLNVILAQNKKAPVISAQVWVKNGSADEFKGEEGLSHFIEHLVFKGTEKYEVGDIARNVEGAGGQLNAYTSFDQTVYYMTLSKEYRDQAIEMLSEMVGRPRFDKEEVNNEREVVIEEIKRGRDNPGRVASRTLFENAYRVHPYKRPVIGYERVVKGASLKRIKEFFAERYSTKNMFFLLVGDFETAQAKKEIAAHFGDLKAHKVKKRSRPQESLQNKARIKITETDFNKTYCYMSFPIPNVKHKDIPALDLLSMTMGYGDSSILSSRLRNQEAIVSSVGCNTYTPKDKGVFIISAMMQPESYRSFAERFCDILEQEGSVVFSNMEIQKAITALENHEYFSMETVDGLASSYGNNELLLGDPLAFQAYMRNMRSLGPDDLLRVFKKYLKPEKMNISVSTNLEKSEARKASNLLVKSYATAYEALKKTKLEKRKSLKKATKLAKAKKGSQANVEEIAQGVSLVIMPATDTATVSLQMAIEGGVRFETAQTNGIYSLISDCILSGTNSKTEEQLNRELEDKAIYLSSFSGRNSYGLRLSSLSDRFIEGLEYLKESLLHPSFEQSALDREKKMTIDYLKSKNDNPSRIAHEALMKALFKNHPYAFETLGTLKSIPKLNQEMCFKEHEKCLRESKVVVTVVGAIDPKEVKKAVKGIFSDVKRSYDGKAFKKMKWQTPVKNKNIRYKLPKEQSHIFLAYPGLCLDDPRRYTLKVMESILAGQGGRLFIELRDKASLAYTVSPIRMEGVDGGYFGSYIGCSPEKEKLAVKMMKAEFSKLLKELVSEEELIKAKQNLIGKFDIQMQKNSAIASKMTFDELYGVGFDEKDRNTQNLMAVTREQIQELAQEIFTKPYVLSVVEGKV